MRTRRLQAHFGGLAALPFLGHATLPDRLPVLPASCCRYAFGYLESCEGVKKGQVRVLRQLGHTARRCLK